MYKILRVFILTLILFALLSIQLFAFNTTEINQLIENAKTFDGKQVVVRGETIGEVMQRGNYSWVNINDGSNAIGIWMKNSDAQQITLFGNYKNIGDNVVVDGVFYRACPEHGGEADIHCATLKITKTGFPVTNPIPTIRGILVFVLFSALVIVFFIIYHFKLLKNSPD
ncbi:MAG: DNA-binding protein [Clostridia bacterium]